MVHQPEQCEARPVKGPDGFQVSIVLTEVRNGNSLSKTGVWYSFIGFESLPVVLLGYGCRRTFRIGSLNGHGDSIKLC